MMSVSNFLDTRFGKKDTKDLVAYIRPSVLPCFNIKQ